MPRCVQKAPSKLFCKICTPNCKSRLAQICRKDVKIYLVCIYKTILEVQFDFSYYIRDMCENIRINSLNHSNITNLWTEFFGERFSQLSLRSSEHIIEIFLKTILNIHFVLKQFLWFPKTVHHATGVICVMYM